MGAIWRPARQSLPAVAGPSAPSTRFGAGDALLATATLALGAGATLQQAAFVGSLAAAVEIGQVGNVPVHGDGLLDALLTLSTTRRPAMVALTCNQGIPMIDLSIVVPTCNRAALLETALRTITRQTQCSYEIIVVDGASTDHTAAVLEPFAARLGERMTIFREPVRRGFVRAANLGLRAARGRNLCWINDDARPVADAIDAAVAAVDASPADVLAMFHRWHSEKNLAYQMDSGGRTFSLCHVRGTLYANFPIARRTTFERLGFLDARYRFCGADPDFSLAAWNTGVAVRPAWGVCLDHDEHADDRRAEDSPAMAADNAALFAKWDLPPKNLVRNDFDPANPCTLRGLREGERLAA